MSTEPESLQFFKVNIDNLESFIGLIVTDFHIGKFNDFLKEKDTLISKLKQLVNEINPTHLFILGDIINYSESSPIEWYYEFFNDFKKNILLPTYIIPGNHDRHPQFMNCFHQFNNDEHLRCIDADFLEIPFNTFSVFLVHDAKYDSNLYGMLPIADWMNKIRNWKCCQKNIKKNDIIIFGHAHTDFDDEENKNHVIGPFSISLKGSSYCIISNIDGNFQFQHYK